METVTSLEPQRIHQCRQRGRLKLTTGIVQEKAGDWRRPFLQHTDKPSLCDMLRDLLFIGETETNAGERRLNHQVRIVDYERAADADRD